MGDIAAVILRYFKSQMIFLTAGLSYWVAEARRARVLGWQILLFSGKRALQRAQKRVSLIMIWLAHFSHRNFSASFSPKIFSQPKQMGGKRMSRIIFLIFCQFR